MSSFRTRSDDDVTLVDGTREIPASSSSHTSAGTPILGFAALSLAIHIIMLGITSHYNEQDSFSLSGDSAGPATLWVTLAPPNARIPPSLTHLAPTPAVPVPTPRPVRGSPPPNPMHTSPIKFVPSPVMRATSNSSNSSNSSNIQPPDAIKPVSNQSTPNSIAVEAPRSAAIPSSSIQRAHAILVPEPAAGTHDDDPRDAIRSHLREFIIRNKIYPALAKRKGWHGDVILVLSVTPQGRITTIQLAQSSGYKILDDNALGLIRNAPPVPIASLGHHHAIDVDLEISYQFN